MDSYKKETHRYAFELVKAAREMAVDIAEKLPHLTEIYLIRSKMRIPAVRASSKKRLISISNLLTNK